MPTDARVLHDAAHGLPRAPAPDDPLVQRLAGSPIVLLGEASHGTHEFYDLRAQLTRTLIEHHDFHAVAIEGDWPDAFRVHRWVTGQSDDADARAALAGFTRFPLWMWRNHVVAEFVEWLRERNAAVPPTVPPAAFVGLDLYSLHRSIDEMLAFLDRTDPAAAARARDRYACFDHATIDGQRYGYATASGRQESCEPAVVRRARRRPGHRLPGPRRPRRFSRTESPRAPRGRRSRCPTTRTSTRPSTMPTTSPSGPPAGR